MNKFLLTLSAATLLGTAAFAQTLETNEVTKTFADIADTWIRTDNTGQKNAPADKLQTLHEVSKDADTQEVTITKEHVALISFEFEIPEGMKVKSATLHLTTERYKGLNVSLFEFHTFKEDCNWDTEGANVKATLENEPLAIFTPAGQKTMAIGDASKSSFKDEFKNIESWTNNIDLTNYFKTLKASTTSVSFMLAQQGDTNGDQNCFISKERTSDVVFGETTIPVANVIPHLTVVFVEDANSFTDTLSPAVDTYIRKGNTANHGGDTAMEIYWTMTKDANNNDVYDETTNLPVRNAEFYGLMRFNNLPIELKSENYELESAVLRLTCTQNKGDRMMNVYDFPASFEGNVKFTDVESTVASTLENEPITTFSVNGQGGKTMGDKDITEQYKDVAAWQNYIDLTDYLKAKEDPTQFGIMLGRKNANSNAIKFGTNEAADAVNTQDAANPFTFAAEDLRPQLKITYKKKETVGDDPTSIVEAIDGADVNAPVEYYNLQGVKIANPDRGIYIVRQGSKVRKVIL